ncbi:MAG TPA: hypothetical protein PKA28_17945 [Methylomusa anaerophila]|uniref:Uncharacterized protein n=1 Tax=Methylomusa anaerophila TaxID=1930071 RepID=A0A348AQM9_9FIRM|nr:hypothetical protein [Methylomusa anaerophila]BBB93377.1 hypothetical protein MAMMFC1_04089 [Methylomusa anaerophila]HML90325.1 hypothetical protein [Methylomusa anaerophila]
MTIKSEEFKTAMSAVRERIAAAKRRGTHSGFIDYHGCTSVCNELIAILEDAGKAAERGDCAYAYSVAALVLVNCAKLAGSADDSAGGITDTRSYVEGVLKKACSGVERGSAEAEFIFLQSLKDSRNKAFDGWDEFAYDLLLPTAELATAKNVNKLYAVLDEFDAKLSQKEYSSWHQESDCLVRLTAITAIDGEQAAEKFVSDNIQYDGIRRIAICNALDKSDFHRAERLCRDKINSTDRAYHWTREWYDILFEVYSKSGDKERRAELAEDLLLGKHDTKYYTILKQLLSEKGVWTTEYPSILAKLAQNLPYNMYMGILSKEGETRRLLEQLIIHPSEIFTYGKQLSTDFPAETYDLCLNEIRKQAAEADNRIKYKQVCGNIKKLFDYGGNNEVSRIIEELKAKYPRRPAMIEELDGSAVRLAKKR